MFASDTYHMFKPTMNFWRGYNMWEFIRGQESDNWKCASLDSVDPSKYFREGVSGSKPSATLYQHLFNNADRKGDDDHCVSRTFRKAIEMLDRRKGVEPFYLVIDEFTPHEPWDPPKRLADLYDPDWDEDWEPIAGHPRDMAERLRQRVRALYYGSVTFVDEWMGRLFDKLAEMNLEDNTMVIVCSDHGTELWDHGICGKMTNKVKYRCNSQILFMLRLPKSEHGGKHVKALVQNQDIFPTILRQTGVDYDRPIDGIDLTPIITGQSEKVRDYAITGWRDLAGVRDGRHAYSCRWEKRGDLPLEELLFDWESDPLEQRDVTSEQPAEAARLRGELEKFLGAPVPRDREDGSMASAPDQTEAPLRVWLDRRGAD
jgi:arylsulfatase A-like enzyme